MGIGSGFAASVSGLHAATRAQEVTSANIAASSVIGGKTMETFTQAIYNVSNGSNGSTGAGVIYGNIMKISTPGTPIRTNEPTNIMINGNGAFIVKDATGTTTYTRAGDFSVAEDNTLKNKGGFALMGWRLDANEQMPSAQSMLDSLELIKVENAIAQASATTHIDVSILLNAAQEVVGDQTAVFSLSDPRNTSTNNLNIGTSDIIYPNQNNNLTVGEGFSVKVGGKVYNISYGGFAETAMLDKNGIDLASNGATKLATDNLSISVGNFTNKPIMRGSGATNIEVMRNIVDQLNATSGPYAIKARLIDNGSNVAMLFAPDDANFAMTFAGSADFRDVLGLTDSANTIASADGMRFASFSGLENTFKGIPGIQSTLSGGELARLDISSSDSIYLKNYNPLGNGSDFLKEFSLKDGYCNTQYNLYDENSNMAGGDFRAHYTRDFIAYDALGNAHNFLIRYLKVATNKWAVEIHSMDKTAVDLQGRNDGLVMAGYMKFDGFGNLESITTEPQPSVSSKLLSASSDLGATPGQKLDIVVGASNYSFEYNPAISKSAVITGSGTDMTTATVGNDSNETLDVSIGSNVYHFKRGSGATNKDVLANLADQINATYGPNALRANLDVANGDEYTLTIHAMDRRSAVSYSDTTIYGTGLNTSLGLQNMSSNANRFNCLYDLADRINETTGIEAISAKIIPINNSGTTVHKISIQPTNAGYYMSFAGDIDVIKYPLANQDTETIGAALGLKNTSATTAMPGLQDEMTINWSSEVGAAANLIDVSWGSVGTQDGMSQVSKDYSVRSLQQNGVSIGELIGLEISESGDVIANFSNSKSRKLYRIPIADFGEINRLDPRTGGDFIKSVKAGTLNLKEPGKEGAGTTVSNVCESSNVDITDQLSQSTVWLLQFQANAKLLSVNTEMLDELIHRTFA